jgi:hypothetical protein
MSILKRTTVPAIVAAAALFAAMPGTAAAQTGVSLVPWAGAYIPTKNSVSDLDNALSRDVSVIGGARLTFWGTGRLGFEAVGGYAPAKISGTTINEKNTDLLAASARLLLALSPVTTPSASTSPPVRHFSPGARIRWTTTGARPTSAPTWVPDSASR